MDTSSASVLVYSPKVEAYIAHEGADGKVTTLDVSKDIVSGSVSRRTGGVSTASLVLNNRARRYNGLVKRMDRIHIRFWKGALKYPCFTGYIVEAPEYELWNTTFTIQCQDTLKTLLHTYWDTTDNDNVARYIVNREPIKQTKVSLSLGASSGTTSSGSAAGVKVVGPEEVQQLVNFAMAALQKFTYSQASGRTQPDKSGHTDCSGFVTWCYKSTLGIDLGADGDNSTRGIVRDGGSLLETGVGHPDESKLQSGDLILYDWGGDGGTDHVEMYVGSGMLIGAGSGIVPKLTRLTNLNGKKYWVKRYVSTSSAGQGATAGTTTGARSSDGTSPYTYDGSTTSATTEFDERQEYFTQQAADGLAGIRLKGFLNEVCGWDYAQLLIEAMPEKLASIVSTLNITEGASDPDVMLQSVYSALMGDTFAYSQESSEASASSSGDKFTGAEGGGNPRITKLMYGVGKAVSGASYKAAEKDIKKNWAKGGSGFYGFVNPGADKTKAQQDAAALKRMKAAIEGAEKFSNKKVVLAFLLGKNAADDLDDSHRLGGSIDNPTFGAIADAAVAATSSLPYSNKLSTDPAAASGANAGATASSSTVLSNFLKGLREHESGGSYTIRTAMSGSDASGAYQYISTTWNNFGGYPAAYLAPPAVQDERASKDAIAAWNTYHDWERVAANHFYPVWAGKDKSTWNAAVPNNAGVTMYEYVHDVCKYLSPSDLTTAPDGASTGTGATGGSSSSDGDAILSAIDQGLYSFFKQTTANNSAYGDSALSAQLTGEKALMNDVPAIDFVKTLCSGSMRDFQSDPYGNFVSFFPDYYGQYKDSAAQNVVDIQAVELKDFGVSAGDNIWTHVYVLDNAEYPDLYGMTSGLSMDKNLRMQQATGVVTMENTALVSKLLGITEKEVTRFLARFGGRPHTEDKPFITNKTFANVFAIQTFLRRWSEQYNSRVEFTFMPELWPGCRARIADTGVGVYVAAVNHSFSYTGGFSTTATVSCIQALSPEADVPGLPRGYTHG